MSQLRNDDSPGRRFGRVGRHSGVGRHIYRLLRSQMADGTLPVGACVPSTRTLAAELGVSRTTVTAAYEQLAAEGFIVTAPGRVARVAAVPVVADPPERTRMPVRRSPAVSDFARRIARLGPPALASPMPPAIDFRHGAIARADFPSRAWRRQYQAALARPVGNLGYIEPEGDAGLRRALQGYLGRARGIACDAEQVLVVNGSQQAIDLCARLLLDPDDAFVFEDPGYHMARYCFEATGARFIAASVDEHGIDTARLPPDDRVRLAFVTPSHQFPLGGILPIGRRQQLLQWARERGAWIIEDDYDGEFRYGQRPIDALRALDTDGRVIYVGTFSKALSPQLRLGYLVLPDDLVPLFRQAKRMSDRHAPVLEQRVLASLLEDGVYDRHVRRVRRENERRRSTLLEAIGRHLPADTRVAGAAAGLHMVIWLTGLDIRQEAALVELARNKHGVGVHPVSPLYARLARRSEPARCAGLILGYASLDEGRIVLGIRKLGEALAELVDGGG